MSELNFPTKMIRLTKATLTIVTCCVKIQNDCSEFFDIRQGLRQGDVLSTLLFNVMLEVFVRRANLITGKRSMDPELLSKFSLHNGINGNGIRVVILKSLQQKVLRELHVGHFGITRMKALARSFCYWKGIDHDIENLVRSCRNCCMNCCMNQNNADKNPSHPWEYPGRPWQRIHIDYAAPFMQHNFLVIVDAYTKWPEIFPTSATNTQATIGLLRQTFA
jgi:hypothetical protein